MKYSRKKVLAKAPNFVHVINDLLQILVKPCFLRKVFVTDELNTNFMYKMNHLTNGYHIRYLFFCLSQSCKRRIKRSVEYQVLQI